jgi:hypothetical protein
MSTPRELADYLAEVGAKPFDWATWNCCTFAAGWVQRRTGIDVMHGLARTASRHAAWRLVGQVGGSLQQAWSTRLGAAHIAPELAQAGDVVLLLVPGAIDEAVGLCAGRLAACVTPEDGIAMFPMDWATHAWRVEPAK